MYSICNHHCVICIIGAVTVSGYYNVYELPILITEINCTGSEESFLNCSYNMLSDDFSNSSGCYSYDDAAVVCQSKCMSSYS